MNSAQDLRTHNILASLNEYVFKQVLGQVAQLKLEGIDLTENEIDELISAERKKKTLEIIDMVRDTGSPEQIEYMDKLILECRMKALKG